MGERWTPSPTEKLIPDNHDLTAAWIAQCFSILLSRVEILAMAVPPITHGGGRARERRHNAHACCDGGVKQRVPCPASFTPVDLPRR
jgi:hypothetical protein